jgi:hypothetical protein
LVKPSSSEPDWKPPLMATEPKTKDERRRQRRTNQRETGIDGEPALRRRCRPRANAVAPRARWRSVGFQGVPRARRWCWARWTRERPSRCWRWI